MSERNLELEIAQLRTDAGIITPEPGNILTAGEFETEAEAWRCFDEFMKRAGAFRIYHEVCGEYIQPRAQTDEKAARIDRLMIPLAPAIEAGWREGAIGVEGKKSGHKIGGLVSQALDYSRCLWELKNDDLPQNHSAVPGLLLMTKWVFIYPVERATGDIESVMAQNRIGYVRMSNRSLVFSCGGMNVITLTAGGVIECKKPPMGRKRGSR